MLAPAHAASDVIHYKYWARLVTVEGIARAYSGTYPETAAIYPPLTMYGYRLAGLVYQAAVEPSFDLDRALGSRALSLLVKLVAVIPHLVTIGAIFWLLRVRNRTASGSAGPRIALAAAAAYGLNPASLFDLAYWGQPDSVHALCLLLAIWCLEEGRSLGGWGFAGLAATAKPQAWALLPFVAYVSVRRFGFAKSTLGVAVAVLVGLGVCLPFLLAGTFGDLLSLPGLITSTMPVVSANAHNLWWLATEARPEFVFDAEPLLGPFTYRQLAAALTVAVYGYGLWKTDPRGRDGALLAMAAYVAFGWFVVTTRAHENHAFMVLPLLAVAAPRSYFLMAAFAIISATQFLNMALHDFSLEPLRESLLGAEAWVRLQLLNAGLNVALFVAWSAWVWRRGPLPHGRDTDYRPA